MTVAEFIAQAHQVQHDEAAKQALCDRLRVWLYAQGRSDLTVAKKDIPRYKEALRQGGLIRGKYVKDFGETWLLYLSADREKMTAYTADYERKRNTHVRGHQYIIRNAHAIVEQALALLDSSTGYDVIAGLTLLTGRRESELGITARFRPMADAPMWATFTGQLKNGEAGLQEVKQIVLLGNRKKVLEGFQHVRRLQSWHTRYTPKSFDACVAPDVRKKCKDIFTPFFPNCELSITAHGLRKAHAAIANAWCPHPGWSDSGFIASLMGHAITDHASVLAYEYFGVEESQP